MAQSTLVPLTVVSRGTQQVGGIVWNLEMPFLASPILVNADGETIVRIKELPLVYGSGEGTNIYDYVVTETLDAIVALGEDLVKLTVTRRETQTFSTPENRVFYLTHRLLGPIQPKVVASVVVGSTFYIWEFGSADPIYYEVSQTPSQIIALLPSGTIQGAVTSPFYTYASGVNTLADGDMRHESDGVALVTGKVFRSDVAGGTELTFGGGDEFALTTDGQAASETYISGTPTQLTMATVDGSIDIASNRIAIGHTSELQFNVDDILFPNLAANTIPFINSANLIADSYLSQDIANTTLRLASGIYFGSHINGETTIDFGGAAGNQFNVYTDSASGGAEAAIEMQPTAINLTTGGGAGGRIQITAASNMNIVGITNINFFAPLVYLSDAASMDLAVLGGTYSLFDTNAATVNFGRAGGALNVLSQAVFSQDVDITTLGSGLKIQEGVNAKMGVGTLVAGTLVVANTSVTANSRIFLTTNTPGGTPGFLHVSARVVGTSFTILSSDVADTSEVAWLIIEPS